MRSTTGEVPHEVVINKIVSNTEEGGD